MSSATIETTMPGSNQRLPLAVRIALQNCASSLYFWGWLAGVALLGPMSSLGAEAGFGLTTPALGAVAAGLVALNPVITRFATYRPRIVPGYRQVHLAAMGLTGAALFGLLTAWIAAWSQTPLRSTIGWTALAFAAGCSAIGSWKIGTWTFWMIVFGTPTLLPRGVRNSDLIQEAWHYAKAGWVNVLLIALAGFLLARVARRLWGLGEDDPDFKTLQRLALAEDPWYRAPGHLDLAAEHSSCGANGRGPLAIRLQEWRLEKALRRGPESFAWTVRRWGLARVDTLSAWLTPPVVLLAALGIWLVMTGRFEAYLPPDWSAKLKNASLWVMIYPVIIGVGAFQQLAFGGSTRSALLAFESLRPASRMSLVRQRGTALLWRMAGWSLLFAVLWATECAVWRSRDPDYPISLAAAWGCVEIASLVAFSGLIAWLQTLGLNIQNPIVSLFVISPILIEALVVGSIFDRGNPAVLYAVAAAISLAGVWIFRVAYRWWLMMDLE